MKNGRARHSITALKAACVAQEYTHHKDKLLMRPKDELKEGISDTTGFDILDAMALNKAFPVAKRSASNERRQREEREYDPLSNDVHRSAYQPHHVPTENDYNPLDTTH